MFTDSPYDVSYCGSFVEGGDDDRDSPFMEGQTCPLPGRIAFGLACAFYWQLLFGRFPSTSEGSHDEHQP